MELDDIDRIILLELRKGSTIETIGKAIFRSVGAVQQRFYALQEAGYIYPPVNEEGKEQWHSHKFKRTLTPKGERSVRIQPSLFGPESA